MPSSNRIMIKRLQSAINKKFDEKLLYNSQQWYSTQQDRPVTMYVLRKAVWDENKHKTVNKELFSSTSQIQIVLYLRDYWYRLNGWEVPTDNEYWENVKKARGLIEKDEVKETVNG